MTLTLTKHGKNEFVVYSNRARIGYITNTAPDRWVWELVLLSEQYKGHPRGTSDSKDKALVDMTKRFEGWCKAAGLN